MSVPISANARGTNLSRLVRAITLSHGRLDEAIAIAREWKDSPSVYLVLEAMRTKTAVPAGTTTDTGNAAELHQYTIDAEFLELYRDASALARMASAMRATPFNTYVPRETSGAVVASWIAESGLKGIGSFSFDSITLDHFKMAAIVVISEELARLSKPSAELTIRKILVDGVASAIDVKFLSADAEVAGESPAGVANGQQVYIGAATPTDLMPGMANLLGSWRSPCWVMRPKALVYLASQLNTSSAFFNFSGNGIASLLGLPVFTSLNCPAQRLFLIDRGSILLADEGATSIGFSRQSTIMMDNGTSPETATEVSLWQRNLVAIRAERYLAWKPTHDAAVVTTVVTWA